MMGGLAQCSQPAASQRSLPTLSQGPSLGAAAKQPPAVKCLVFFCPNPVSAAPGHDRVKGPMAPAASLQWDITEQTQKIITHPFQPKMTERSKPRISRLAFQLLKEKELLWEEESSLSPLMVYKDV